jgi:hypothetical protein
MHARAIVSGFVIAALAAIGVPRVHATDAGLDKEACRNGGWRAFDGRFRNQGQCIAYVDSLKESGADATTVDPIAPGAVDAVPGLPDLVVDAIDIQGVNRHGGLTWNATIRNIGGAPVDVERVAVQGWYSADLHVGGDTAGCGAVLATAPHVLEPNQTIALGTRTCGIALQPEHRYLLVVVDSANKIAESDETNNVGSQEIPR